MAFTWHLHLRSSCFYSCSEINIAGMQMDSPSSDHFSSRKLIDSLGNFKTFDLFWTCNNCFIATYFESLIWAFFEISSSSWKKGLPKKVKEGILSFICETFRFWFIFILFFYLNIVCKQQKDQYKSMCLRRKAAYLGNKIVLTCCWC